MRARRGPEPTGVVEVVLDDAPADPAYGPRDGPPPAGDDADGAPLADEAPGHRRGRRRLRALGGVAAAAALALVVGANVAEVRADRARDARLAGQPGVVASLAEPVQERWRVEGWLAADLGHHVLLDTPDGLRAVDPVTGAVAWGLDRDARAGSEYCRPSTDGAGWADGPGLEADLLVCVPYSETAGARDGEHELLVLDARTGERRHVLAASGGLLGVEWTPTSVAVLLTTPEGTLHVVAWDPRTGEQLVDTTTRAQAFSATTPGSGALGWERRGDVVLITGDVGAAAVDLVTGAEVDPLDATAATSDAWESALPDGSTAVWTWDAEGGRGHVVGADGTRRFALPAPPLAPWVDDGAVPEVLVVADEDGLAALDVRTGDVRWTAELGFASALVAVDGVLVLAHGTRTLGVDLRSGATLWEVASAGSGYPAGVTDGELVLLTETGEDGRGSTLVARTVAHGEEAWRVAVDGPAWGLTSVGGGRLLLATDTAVVGLG
ncbi:outer membrane protein assembly factor BamB family protein [Actinotalea solisilvae]|uniref:outer membrane protein assembly factor BamB family protein n=1 Tax=Actinotalea solisilvae TaxID=2072922 RepID=UPI0018F1216E|nr:PQQ-binding-like beta-propeller repeat protein [Actinotalea solisilvae]